jgi:membrane protein required for beta-lactamase induction
MALGNRLSSLRVLLLIVVVTIGKRGTILTYDAFLKILDDALVALEDDDGRFA